MTFLYNKVMIKAVLFDLDGTLIDSETYYVNETYKYVVLHNKQIKREDCFGIIGLTMPETYEYVSKLVNLDYQTTQKEYDQHFIENKIVFKDLLFGDVTDCFDYLKKNNISIGICSMSNETYVKKCIEDCGLGKYVDYYIGGDECKHNKPNPEIYLKALNVLKMEQKNVIVVEDAATGIMAGKNAGLYVVARDASRFKMKQDLADIIIKDLKELINIINYE